MIGLCIIWANSKPKKMIDFYSQGFILFAVKNEQCEIVRPPGIAVPGERCYLEGSYFSNDDWAPIIKSDFKQKIVDRCMPYFYTDEKGIACWVDMNL